MIALKRYAIVRGLDVTRERVAAYLPRNYRVIWAGTWPAYEGQPRPDDVVVIQGEDSYGYSLEQFVIPRCGSGMMRVDEIDLSHPIMKEVPS